MNLLERSVSYRMILQYILEVQLKIKDTASLLQVPRELKFRLFGSLWFKQIYPSDRDGFVLVTRCFSCFINFVIPKLSEINPTNPSRSFFIVQSPLSFIDDHRTVGKEKKASRCHGRHKSVQFFQKFPHRGKFNKQFSFEICLKLLEFHK